MPFPFRNSVAVRAFRVGPTNINIHDEEQTRRPSIISGNVVHRVDKKVNKNKRFIDIWRVSQIVRKCSLWKCNRTLELSTVVFTMATENSSLGPQKQTIRKCTEFIWSEKHATPESNQQSMEVSRQHHPRQSKLLVDFSPPCEPINSTTYCETPKKLRLVI